METKKQIINLIRFVIFFQLAIVGATIFGCFMPSAKPCDADVKQHIANMMTVITCLLYTSPSPRDLDLSRMPSSA